MSPSRTVSGFAVAWWISRMEPHWLSKTDILGAASSFRCRSYKLEYQLWGSNPSLLTENLCISSSLPSVCGCPRRGNWGKIVPQPLLSTSVGFFPPLVCLMCRNYSASSGVFQRTSFLGSCGFGASVGEVSSRSSYFLDIDPDPDRGRAELRLLLCFFVFISFRKVLLKYI